MYVYFFFNDTATTEIYTLSLHDALPIFLRPAEQLDRPVDHVAAELEEAAAAVFGLFRAFIRAAVRVQDRKSTRLNSSHITISYAVFCLKKKKKNNADF